MPVLASDFRPPFLLRGGHVQTILAALRPRRIAIEYRREVLELPDGDFLDLDWAGPTARRLAIISHGLESSSNDPTIRGIATALVDSGWTVLAWNFRGCGGTQNRLPRFYHSGDTVDLGRVIAHAATRFPTISLIGLSLGGNLILKYLGESPPHPAIRSAIAVSAPIDLASSALKLDRQMTNRIYLTRFLRKLTQKVRAKAVDHPTAFDLAPLKTVRGFSDFDDQYTGPAHGFQGAADYWQQSSARQYLPGITVPSLLLSALDDPFLDEACFPWPEARQSPQLFLEAPAHGGHLGFLSDWRQEPSWLETRICAFLQSAPEQNVPAL